MLKRILKTVCILFFAGMMINASAQTNTSQKITGKVTDSITGESLVGVSVYIKGTQNGTTTDVNGEYSLNNVTKGQVLVFSFIGFETQEIKVGANQNINISFKNTAQQIEGVVITVQVAGQKNAIQKQINSTTIKNVVAADRLQANPDANAVEAIGRLPGISVSRSGGEGNGLVIRGLESKYTAVTLNGVLMPSTGGSRETNISGISQYMMQGVEVYKSNTADMEANSVAGTVNITTMEASPGFKTGVLAQMGYNNMNNYYGNYNFAANVSNRFLNDKLGVMFTGSAERVNRSTQTLSAGLDNGSSAALDILVNSFSLNNIYKTNYRRSAMLALDYKVASSTKLKLYGMYINSKNESESQSKSYAVTGKGTVNYGFSDNPFWNNNMLQTALSGNTKSNFLDMELDYGVAYSQSITDDPQSRSWGYGFNKVPLYDPTTVFSLDMRRLRPQELIGLFNDRELTEESTEMISMNQYKGRTDDKNLSTYLNVKVPYKIGDFIAGHVKAGGMYRNKKHKQNIQGGSALMITNQFAKPMLADSLDWLVRSGTNRDLSLVGMRDFPVDNFLDNQYDYGYYYDFAKLNQITDMWAKISDFYYPQGPSVYQNLFGGKEKIGFNQDIAGSMLNDQDIVENYTAGYIMTEINFGKYVMFLPGVRYEETSATMQGFKALQPTQSPPMYDLTPGDSVSATRSDHFFLPYIQLRIKPGKAVYAHFSYTQTLGRPDFNTISPNTYYNTGFQPYTYITNAPDIKVERWTNYEGQLSVHTGKIGLVTLGGFYKTVEDKIWYRGYKRIKGDPIIEPFPDASLVNVALPENHRYSIYLKGVEVDVQTSFWYLPKPFKFFTLYANYTYTNSQTQYPWTKIVNVVPPGGGRPVPVRIDSTISGPMLNQPRDIFNASLGFNNKGLNIWLSYQYNGKIFTTPHATQSELYDLKEYYNRWDLQISQKLPGKLKGLEVLAKIANLTNFTETTRKKGDPRPTYIEKYGWTADLGVRYSFNQNKTTGK